MDAEEVGFGGGGAGVKTGAADDEDGRVDKQREGEERGGEFDDGVFETGAYSVDARAVLLLVVEGLRAMHAD